MGDIVVLGRELGLVLGFGIPGLREIVLVGLVALVLYGRGGSRLLMATREGRSLSPWLNLVRLPSAAKGRQNSARLAASKRRHGRWYWGLVIIASVVLAALVATRVMIQSGAGASH